MATETHVRIKRNPYQGFEVWVWGNGELTRRSFNNNHELMTVLTGECVDDDTLRQAADLFDDFEWDCEAQYPLGVSYRPEVAEAVCDSPVDEPVVDPRWRQAIESNTRCQFWKSLCGIAAFSCGLAVFSLFVVLSRK